MGVQQCCGASIEAKPKEKSPDITLLILGISQVGKSTFFKQLRFLHGERFSLAEKENLVKLIRYNIVLGIRQLTEMAEKKQIPLDTLEFETDLFETANEREDHPFDQKTVLAAKTIWNRKEIIELRKDFSVKVTLGERNLEYFMNKIDNIALPDYTPSDEDFFCCRQRTVGLAQLSFKYNKKHIKVIDMGGQEAERKKWGLVAPQASALIYLCALTHYDLPSQFENDRTQLDESLEVWDDVLDSENFKNCAKILFLNKKDLFEQQIQEGGKRFMKTFPEFSGNLTTESCVNYIREMYLEKARSHGIPHVTSHLTCAIDPLVMDTVFNTVMFKLMNEMIDNFIL